MTQSTQRWLGLVALFVAPTSLLTGLCYFFGLVYLRSRLDYFGIDPSTLGLTTADYVVAVTGPRRESGSRCCACRLGLCWPRRR
jgi:hypothetical protein